MPIVKKFLLFCSGAFASVLEQIDSPQEEEKYAAHGITVLSTSLLATFSGGYALYAVFGTLLLAVPFALFWGGNILLLDRALLMTMKKQQNKPFKQFLSAVPRLMLALVIGFTVSKPLELKIFESEIQEVARAQEIDALKDNLQTLIKTRKEAEADGRQALADASRLSASVIAEKRANALMHQQEAKQKFNETKQLNKQIADVTKHLNSSENSSQKIRLGLLKQLVFVEQMSKQQPVVSYAGWLLSTLFVLVEILPVLTKLMSKYSEYDAALERQDAVNIKQQNNMQEAGIEQIQQDFMNLRDYRKTLSKAALEELTRASKAQLVSVIRQADTAAQKEAHQVDMVEAATDRITDEIKNAIKAPIEADSAKPSKNGNFSAGGFRQILDKLFWQNMP